MDSAAKIAYCLTPRTHVATHVAMRPLQHVLCANDRQNRTSGRLLDSTHCAQILVAEKPDEYQLAHRILASLIRTVCNPASGIPKDRTDTQSNTLTLSDTEQRTNPIFRTPCQ